ncbi:MAG TPA: hypothetical protein VN896_13070 [Methylomirabilota bacterium]|jgi:hypothetical protein|nr:hypothetical protein [Methylomirabilota bacterium]
MRTHFSKPSRLQRTLCALLLLPGLWAPARSLVLCIELDGRVTVEVGQSACDAPEAAALASGDAHATEISEGCCGACTDLPLGGVQLRQPVSERTLVRLVATGATVPVALSPAVPAPRLEASRFGPECGWETRPASSPRLTPLRC